MAAEALEVQLTGDVAVLVDGERASEGLGRQVQLALAFLISERSRPVRREELADVLWEEALPASWETALRGVVAKVRRALGVAKGDGPRSVETVDGCYRLRVDPLTVDVERAATELGRAREALATSDPAAALRHAELALDVTSRPYLPGVTGSWAEARQRHLEDRRRDALELAAGAALLAEAPHDAARYAERLIECDPLFETGHRLLIEARARAGTTTEAVRAFERCRAILRAELELDPSPETAAVLAAVLAEPAGRVAGVPPVSQTACAIRFPVPVAQIALVGRDEPLRIMERHDLEAADRRGALTLLSGEPGIGKTRLATEYARRRHATGAVVLVGRCSERDLVAYEPVVRALVRAVEDLDDEARRCLVSPGSAGALRRIMPSLQAVLFDAPDERERADDDTDRYLAFRATTELVRALLAGRGGVLILDDLQWVDEGSAAVLRHLLREPVPGLTIVGTFREAEADDGTPWDTLHGELIRFGADELHLDGLSRDGVDVLVEEWAGHEGPGELADELHASTGGNPFLVQEILRDLVESGELRTSEGLAGFRGLRQHRVPRGATDVILRRVRSLGSSAVDILTIAAVIGSEFDYVVLERACGADLPVLDVVSRGVRARLLAEAEDRPGRLVFAHGLVHEAMLQQLTGPQRATLHRRVGDAMEAVWSADPSVCAQVLAHHFFEALLTAGDSSKAVTYAREAARQATTTLAHEDASTFYQLALTALGRGAAQEPVTRVDLLLGLAGSRARSGRRSEAREAYREAFDAARSLGDAEVMVRAAIGHSIAAMTAGTGPDTTAAALLDEALECLDADADPSLRARGLAHLAFELAPEPLEHRRPKEDLSAQALELARGTGDHATLFMALTLRRYVLVGSPDPDERLRLSDEALRLAREMRSAELEMEALWHVSSDLTQLAALDRAASCLEEMEELARHVGQPHNAWPVLLWNGARALQGARLDEAERFGEAALEAGEGIGDVVVRRIVGQLLSIRRAQGRLDELAPLLSTGSTQRPQARNWRAARALALWELGDREAAVESLHEQLSEPVEGWAVTETLPPALATLGELAWYARDRSAGRALVAALTPYGGQWISSDVFSAVMLGSADRFLGLARAAAGDGEGAADSLRAALEEHRALGAHLWTIHNQIDLADVLLELRGGRYCAEARLLLQEATERARELGLAGLVRKAAEVVA